MQIQPIQIQWQPAMPIFASEQFLRNVSDTYGWLGGFAQDGSLLCFLPFTISSKATVRMVRFRVSTISMIEDMQEALEKDFLNGVVKYFRSRRHHIIIPGATNAVFRTYPDGSTYAPYGTHIIDLTQTEDALWTNLHPKHRNVIRNALNKGVRILQGPEHAITVHAMIEETLRRSSLPFLGFDRLTRLVSDLGSNITLFMAEHEGVVQGCAVILFSDYSAYYLYGGSAEHPITGANNLLQWEAIRHFRNIGVKRYDFCGGRTLPEKGSKQAGLIMYKERFGSQFIQGHMWKYPLHPIRALPYSLAVRLTRGGDIVDQERRRLALA